MPTFHFTYFRLVTKTKKLRTAKIFGHAKNWIVITFGLKDIAVLATFTGEITTPKNRRPHSKSALASLPERKGASYVNTGILLNTVNTKMDNKPIFLG